jgi:carbon monoxide dehydrogenase subunit G
VILTGTDLDPEMAGDYCMQLYIITFIGEARMPSAQFRRELITRSEPGQAWQILTDVPRLADWVTIVGEATEIAPLEHYKAVLADQVGPFKLRADLDIRVPEVDAGRRVRVIAAGEDRHVSSRIAVDATLSLTPAGDGATKILVEGRYEVTGRVASMGSAVIKQKAQKIIEEFFTRAASELG